MLICMKGSKEGGFYALVENISIITCNIMISCLFVSLFNWLTQQIPGDPFLRFLSPQHNLRASISDRPTIIHSNIVKELEI